MQDPRFAFALNHMVAPGLPPQYTTRGSSSLPDRFCPPQAGGFGVAARWRKEGVRQPHEGKIGAVVYRVPPQSFFAHCRSLGSERAVPATTGRACHQEIIKGITIVSAVIIDQQRQNWRKKT